MRTLTLAALAFTSLTFLTASQLVAQTEGRSADDPEMQRPERDGRPERGAPGERFRRPGDQQGNPGAGDPEDGERGVGERGVGERGARGRGGRFRPRNLLFEAMDLNGDQVISKIELRKVAAALKKLDTDKDGEITLAEVTPEEAPGGYGRMARGEGDAGEAGQRGGRFGRGGDPQQFVTRMLENDVNGDGKLTANEVPEEVMPMLQGADLNGDKAIDAEELAKLAETQGQRFGRGGPAGGRGGEAGGRGGDAGGRGPQMAQQMMQRADVNGDGRLTINEVPEQMRQMLQGADANNDGAIDEQELAAAMQRMSGARRGGPNGAGGDPRSDRDPRQQRRNQEIDNRTR